MKAIESTEEYTEVKTREIVNLTITLEEALMLKVIIGKSSLHSRRMNEMTYIHKDGHESDVLGELYRTLIGATGK